MGETGPLVQLRDVVLALGGTRTITITIPPFGRSSSSRGCIPVEVPAEVAEAAEVARVAVRLGGVAEPGDERD